MFLHDETGEDPVTGKIKRKKTMMFPRYHQWRAVRKIITAIRAEGTGRRYLIEHSAGSGKTNTIAWTAHRLARLHDEDNRKVFDKVLIVSDRKVLDRQLQDAVEPGRRHCWLGRRHRLGRGTPLGRLEVQGAARRADRVRPDRRRHDPDLPACQRSARDDARRPELRGHHRRGPHLAVGQDGRRPEEGPHRGRRADNRGRDDRHPGRRQRPALRRRRA